MLESILNAAKTAFIETSRSSIHPPYAVFDADGTLWRLDVAFRLYEYLCEQKRLKQESLASLNHALQISGIAQESDPNAACLRVYHAFLNKEMEESLAFESMVTALAGFTLEELEEAHVQAIGPNAPSSAAKDMFEVIPLLFSKLREIGYRICVISASPVWTVTYALSSCGLVADAVRGGTTEIEGNRITSKLIPPMTYFHGKLAVAKRDFHDAPTIGFGDGKGDIPFLSHCKISVCINPRPALEAAIPSMSSQVFVWRIQ